MPELWGGSADLGGSNKTDLKGAATFAPAECATKQWPNCNEFGRQLHFGVREFTMGCITNGILLGSHTRPFGGTFFMFSDYEAFSAVRLAALMEIPNLYIWSHDSVAVGEDGPTHQPVEHLASFRAIPQLEVIRPADAFETAEAYRYFFEKKNTLPGAMVLDPSGCPGSCRDRPPRPRTVSRRALTFWSTPRALRTSSSWLPVPRSSGLWLPPRPWPARASRLASCPCRPWNGSRSRTPSTRRPCFRPLSRLVSPVEAGVAMPWYKYLGSYGKPVSIEQFGLQATALRT